MTERDRELAEIVEIEIEENPDGLVSQAARAVIRAELAAKAERQHSDDIAVDKFAVAMKEKLKLAREQKGRGGWEQCSADDLAKMLLGHIAKGDMRDVANFAMMLWHNLEGRPVFNMPDFTEIITQAEALRVENERLAEENARLSNLAGKPYYFAPSIDDECTADEIKAVMDDVPIGEVQKIEVHRRTGIIYAVWMTESDLREFSNEEEARAALVQREE